MTRTLLLIRHSESQPSPGLPASRWPLTAAGWQRCEALARLVAPYEPVVVASSYERKTLETSRIVASRLNLPVEVVAGLHEHDRRGVPFYDRRTFLSLVEQFFADPTGLVFGRETAAQAQARFEAGLRLLTTRHPTGNLVATTHGTVLSLFVAAHSTRAALPFWQSLQMPALVVFELPELKVVDVVEKVT